MKTLKLLFFLSLLFFAVSLSAKEIEIALEDWKNGAKGWSTSLAEKKSPPGTMTYIRDKECVDIVVPSELVFLRKDNIPILGITKIKVTLTPLDLDWHWLEVGIIFQSSVDKWRTLGLKLVKKEGNAQTFEFEIDGDWHSDSPWNKMWIRINSHKKVKVRVHAIKAIKVVDDEE